MADLGAIGRFVSLMLVPATWPQIVYQPSKLKNMAPMAIGHILLPPTLPNLTSRRRGTVALLVKRPKIV